MKKNYKELFIKYCEPLLLTLEILFLGLILSKLYIKLLSVGDKVNYPLFAGLFIIIYIYFFNANNKNM